MNYKSKRQKYETLRSQLDLDRSTFVGQWRDLADNFLPRRARFQITDNNRGDRRNNKIIDSTPTFASRTLRSGMMGGVTSPARPWKKLTTPDPELAESGAVKMWLDTVNRRMDTIFLRSNLYQCLPLMHGDLGVFGTHAMLVEEDFETVMRFTPFPIGTYWIACDENGKVNVFMREFRMTVRQLLGKFAERSNSGEIDWSNISLHVKALWEQGSLESWIDVVHVIEPNEEYRPSNLRNKYKKFSSCYYEKGTSGTSSKATAYDQGDLDKKYLRESGYDYFPVLVPRWEVAEGDAYGTDCPGMIALGDAKALQVLQKRGAQAVEKMINPPMVADSALRNSKTTILPGDTTWVENETDGRKKFRPAHEINPRMQEFLLMVEDHQNRINRAFYADLFLLAAEDDRDRTAREIVERHEEKFLVLGPVLEQLHATLDQLIDITFNIMERQDLIPDPPEELAGQELKVEYESVMAQAQKLTGLAGIERFTNYVTNLATVTEDPSVWDKVSRDNLIDHVGDVLSVPPDVVLDDNKVTDIRVARSRAQRQAEQAQVVREEAAAAKDLGSIDMEQNSALTQLLRHAQAGQVQAVN